MKDCYNSLFDAIKLQHDAERMQNIGGSCFIALTLMGSTCNFDCLFENDIIFDTFK